MKIGVSSDTHGLPRPEALGVDAVLFVNLLYTVSHRNRFGGMIAGILACVGIAAFEALRGRGAKK